MNIVRRLIGVWVKRADSPPPERQLGRDAYISLLIHFFFQFGASMSGIFLTLYLWRLTGSLWVNGMYNIIGFAATLMGFIFGGWLAKKKDRLYAYRMGLVLIALFYLSVILTQEKVAEWYVPFAIFYGLAGGFYWTGYLVLMYDVSNDRNRIHYLAMNTIAFTAAGLIGPALAGWIISVNDGLKGYTLVFGTAFAMFLCAALFSLKIRPHPSKRKVYYLKYSFMVMKRERQWAKGLLALFFMGFLNGLMLFLPNILLFLILPREDLVGYLGVLFSGLIILSSTIISKFATEQKATAYMTTAAVGFIAASSLLLFELSLATVIGFLVIFYLMVPLQSNSFNVIYYKQIGMLPPKGQFRVESVVLREVFLNAGRMVSIFILIFYAEGFSGHGLAWVLVGAAASQLLLPLLTREPVKVPRLGLSFMNKRRTL